VFQPPPRSTGKVTAAQPNSVWQADLIDFSTRDVAANQGFKFILVVVDVFARFVRAEPMKEKTARATLQAFETVRGGGPKAPVPCFLDTDTGGEFEGVFDEHLHKLGAIHIQKDPRHKDGLAVVDAAIARLKIIIGKELEETRSRCWVRVLPKAVKALNERPNDHLLGAAPVDIDTNPVLRYALDAQAGREILFNCELGRQAAEKLRVAGAYRVMLPRSDWPRADQPRYSAEVHTVAKVEHSYVTDTEGNVEEVHLVLPVPLGSRTGERQVRVKDHELRQTTLQPFITALVAHLGDGSASLQQAGEFLATIPHYTETVKDLKLYSQGFRVIATMFPELELFGGTGALTRVRVKA
jgi:hypothetical protein